MSRFSSAFRAKDQQFRSALRLHDLKGWLLLWESYGACTTCHQESGRPCLDLAEKSGTIHLADPHPDRPSAQTEKT